MEKIPEPAAARPERPAGPKEPQQQPGKVLVEFYIMSKCPFTAAVQQEIKNVLDKMGDCVDFKQYFIASEKADGSLDSLHGDSEVRGDIVELCAEKYYHEGYRFMDMVACMAQDFSSIPSNWQGCASAAGLDLDMLKACINGKEGKALLSDSLKKSKAAQAYGSPTMYFGGEKYTGGRTEQEFQEAICCSPESVSMPGPVQRLRDASMPAARARGHACSYGLAL